MESSTVLIKRHIRNLRGFSHPFLAEAIDGHWYVVKPYSRQAGSNLSFNECASSVLYRACGLSVPEWAPVILTDDFLVENSEAWANGPDGDTRPHAGLAFGSRFLGEQGLQLLEILSRSSIARVTNRSSFWLAWLIDICAQHADNRQVIFAQSPNRQLRAFFVDHGHVFGGPQGDLTPPFSASRYLDERIYHSFLKQDLAVLLSIVKTLNVDQLWQQVNSMPEEWKTAGALKVFADCLNRLEDAGVLQKTADKMFEAVLNSLESERSSDCANGESKPEVLSTDLPAANRGLRPFEGVFGDRDRASRSGRQTVGLRSC